MKLSDYFPEVPTLITQGRQASALTTQLSNMLAKAQGESYRPDSLGIDQVGNIWLRQQYAYRQQLLIDVFTIANSVVEIRAPIHHIVSETFRRGIEWKSKFAMKCAVCQTEYMDNVKECETCKEAGREGKLHPPDEEQKRRMEGFMMDCNIFDQSLEAVMRQADWAVNTMDDAYIHLVKEYYDDGDKVRSKVIEIRNLEPPFVEVDLDLEGLPKNRRWVCYIHRDVAYDNAFGDCKECGRGLIPTMYIYHYRGKPVYLLDSEVIHWSKFYPGEVYGFSPILSIFEKALSIIGMDKCYDPETEVLTAEGWKRFEEVTEQDSFATLDEQKNLLYQKPTNVMRYWHDGPMYVAKGVSLDLKVTPHHRLYLKQPNGEFAFHEARDVIGQKQTHLRGGAVWEGIEEQTFTLPGAYHKHKGPMPQRMELPDTAWATFLGAWYALGRLGQKGKAPLVFHSNTPSAALNASLARVPVTWKEYLSHREITGGSRAITDFLLPYRKDKKALLEYVSTLSYAAQSEFYGTAKTLLQEAQPNSNKSRKATRDLMSLLVEWSVDGLEDIGVAENNVVIETTAEGQYLPPLDIPMDTWLEFMGYWLAEGHTIPDGYVVGISQITPSKRPIIKACLDKMPIEWSEWEQGFICSDARLSSYLRQFRHAKDKFVPRELLQLSARQLQLLVDAWILGDACITTSPQLRDDMMEAGVKLGYGVSYTTKKMRADKPQWNQSWKVQFSRSKKLTTINQNRQQDGWEDYVGWTYCVEVPNSTLLVRRNGKVVWAGNTVYRYFWERKMPSSMLLVSTDDPESLRRERMEMQAQMRADPNYIPMVAVSNKTSRGRVDMVRLFHSLQEMDYMPVRQEIRERIAEIWGVTPAWQGAPDAFGGLSTQTSQLTIMSRVVENEQRMFHDNVFPPILEAFGITDWELELPQPEEKAEATRISFAQQRTSIAMQLHQAGFTVKLKSTDTGLDDIDFVVSGEPQQQGGMGGGGFGDMFGGGGMGGGGEEAPPGQFDGQGETPTTPQDEGYSGFQFSWPGQLQKAGYTNPVIMSIAKDGSFIIFDQGGKLHKADFLGAQLQQVQPIVTPAPAKRGRPKKVATVVQSNNDDDDED